MIFSLVSEFGMLNSALGEYGIRNVMTDIVMKIHVSLNTSASVHLVNSACCVEFGTWTLGMYYSTYACIQVRVNAGLVQIELHS